MPSSHGSIPVSAFRAFGKPPTGPALRMGDHQAAWPTGRYIGSIVSEPNSGVLLVFEKHKARKAHEQYESVFAAWQAERSELASVLELASSRTGDKSTTVILQSGESVFGSIGGVGLVEIRKVGGHFEGGSAGVSVPIGTINGRSIRYRVGRFRGHYVEGTAQPQAIDRGTLTITNQRFVYMGSSHSIECLFTKLVGIQRLPGALSVSVSNRQKPSVFSFGAALDDWVAFRLDLALAIFNGQGNQFAHEITKQLAELDARKPQDPRFRPKAPTRPAGTYLINRIL